MYICKTIDLQDIEVEVDLDAAECIDQMTKTEIGEALDQIRADHLPTLTDWIADNAEHLDLPKTEPEAKPLSDPQRDAIKTAAFYLETVAHLTGREQYLLPVAEALRAIVNNA